MNIIIVVVLIAITLLIITPGIVYVVRLRKAKREIVQIQEQLVILRGHAREAGAIACEEMINFEQGILDGVYTNLITGKRYSLGEELKTLRRIRERIVYIDRKIDEAFLQKRRVVKEGSDYIALAEYLPLSNGSYTAPSSGYSGIPDSGCGDGDGDGGS